MTAAQDVRVDVYPDSVIAVPEAYRSDLTRDIRKGLLDYGGLAQRAQSPYFVDMQAMVACFNLPDQVVGPRAAPVPKMTDLETGEVKCRQLVAEREARALMDGLSPHFYSRDNSFWHVSLDLSLQSNGRGDAAGIAMGRISGTEVERDENPVDYRYKREVKTFDVPLAARVVSPSGGQISIGGIVEFVLRLKQERLFNITSVSADNFESSMALQEFAAAGIVVPGMQIDADTNEITGASKPFSVDRSTQPYRDFREAVSGLRVNLPAYEVLRQEMFRLEDRGPAKSPDHPANGSKDVLDAVAGVVGYLSKNGHAELVVPSEEYVPREALVGEDLPPNLFGEDDDDEGALNFETE